MIYTHDPSAFGMTGVRWQLHQLLTQVQKDENGVYRDVLIATVGRKNPPALRNVGSPVGEAHAMAFGLSKFKSLLKLAVFDAFSDHVSLKFLACWARNFKDTWSEKQS